MRRNFDLLTYSGRAVIVSSASVWACVRCEREKDVGYEAYVATKWNIFQLGDIWPMSQQATYHFRMILYWNETLGLCVVNEQHEVGVECGGIVLAMVNTRHMYQSLALSCPWAKWGLWWCNVFFSTMEIRLPAQHMPHDTQNCYKAIVQDMPHIFPTINTRPLALNMPCIDSRWYEAFHGPDALYCLLSIWGMISDKSLVLIMGNMPHINGRKYEASEPWYALYYPLLANDMPCIAHCHQHWIPYINSG